MNEEREPRNAGLFPVARLRARQSAMTIETPYLAAEDAAQQRRSRSLCRFLVVSPAALLITVGLVAHLGKPPHLAPAGNAAYDRRVLAYRTRVARVQAMPTEGAIRPAVVEREARAWAAGVESGSLLPLPPQGFEDHLRDGVRGEIAFAGFALASRTSSLAEGTLEAGGFARAADQALLAAESVRTLGDSEITAAVQAMMTQRRAIGVLARAWPRVSRAERAVLRARLLRIVLDPHRLERMVELESRQLEDYAARQRLSPASDVMVVGRTLIRRRLRAAQRGARTQNAMVRSILAS